MGLFEVAAAAAGVFALLQWIIMPRLRKAVTQPRPVRPLRLIVMVILGNVVRSTSLIAAVVFGLIALVLTALSFAGRALSLDQLARIFGGLAELREKIETFDTTWSIATIIVLSLALWIAARRDAKCQLSTAVDQAIERLQADAAAGKLQPLEP